MIFEKVLLESIDEGLGWLGENTKQAVYLHLKNNYSLSKEDIPYRIENFTAAIENTFQKGALLLEIKIMKVLFAKIGYRYINIENPENLQFASYVYALKNSGSYCRS
ncbi:MAG: hypothetical protein JW815_03645 [Candidatus Bathyarchaeota archaeon]|nr:hypothetical protein [Candidatus Bathyarchaeum sp.]